jgi:hypothetical protein
MDTVILETYNGGDISKIGNDVLTVNGFENMPYIAMFGGNPSQSTPTQRVVGEQNFDWFGNAFETDAILQTNSLTERTLRSVALNSAGRVQIEQAVNADLEFMRTFAKVTVVVSIISDDRVQIDINIVELNNLQNTSQRFIWDATFEVLNGPFNWIAPLIDEGIGYWYIEDNFIIS